MENTHQQDRKLWGGRFDGDTNVDLSKLNNSLPIDARLYHEDIEGSKAYASGLENAGIITKYELVAILDGLDKVLHEWNNNEIKFLDSDEDVHTVNERRLTELIGSVGGKLHTGRSRNDQVITDMKLWMKRAIVEIIKDFLKLIKTIINCAENNIDVLFPGYTHLQRAQAVRFSHWLLIYGYYLQSDLERLQDLHRRIDSLPLGSGAIAGNPFDIDRIYLSKILNFRKVTPNSMYAVSDRDFVAEFNFCVSLTAIHLSRMAEDLILYASKEFGFVKLSDAFSTGSSLMPQKRNPDSLELIRGMSGGVFGQLSGFMMTLKGLPSTYNKDLQNDKSSMFYCFDQLTLGLIVMEGVVRTMDVDKDKCVKALSFEMLATDLAYYLVRKNVPFREAHHKAGEVIAFSEKTGIPIEKIDIRNYKDISPMFDDDVDQIWNFEKSVEQYSVIGGTSRASVETQIHELKSFVDVFKWSFNIE